MCTVYPRPSIDIHGVMATHHDAPEQHNLMWTANQQQHYYTCAGLSGWCLDSVRRQRASESTVSLEWLLR